ncbi:MAG: acyl-CoA dehydrogenase family protein [Thermoanaerobacteraceae bacterium]|nr:acyl-CoA dehydrogenase family protein [Thermoanaerobacteraceae bacterium]
MDFKFSEEQEMLRRAVREFAEKEIAPHAAEWDEKDYCPVEVIKEMGELGFLGTIVPEEYGGTGMGYTARAVIIEEVSRYSAGLGIAVMTHSLVVAPILNYGTEEQKKKYLPKLATGEYIGGLASTEPSGGSDLVNQQTTAEFKDGKWVINGKKCFITNYDIADVTLLLTKTGVNEKGRPELTAFIVKKETPGFGIGHKEDKLGLRSSSTGDLNITDLKVGEEAVLGGRGEGQKIVLATIGEVGRSGMSAIGLGIIRGCLEEGLKFAKERELYGKPLTNLQAIQFMIAENRMYYEIGKLLTYRATTLKDEGVRCDVESSMAKLHNTEAAVKAAQRTIELMGGYGVINQYPVGRYLRDAMSTISAGGTSQIMEIVIGGDTIKNF